MKCLLFLAVLLGATVAATPQASPEETAVRNIVQEEIAAWNSGDAAAYSRHFAAGSSSLDAKRLSKSMTTSSRDLSTEVPSSRILFP